MAGIDVQQLELLSAIDDLCRRSAEWADQPSDWEPVQQCQSLLKRVRTRVEMLRVRMEAPLVVATFGGTGTGKSALVNALVGEEVTRSGRQRPTTQRPVLIVHSSIDISQLPLPLDEIDVVQRDADMLRDILLLDCPDPDTTEGEAPGSNLDRLRSLLPHCDVLLYVSTQQKYRSARVEDELASAAAGCRMIFVQTHADLDEDIREDWRRLLSGSFEVPEMYLVDSRRALEEQLNGQSPSGDMGRLLGVLRNKFGASDRVRIRRANVLDLLLAALTRCQTILKESRPRLEELETALAAQKQALGNRMAERLQQELVGSRQLWERRLLSAVTERWGMSPFSTVLRLYNGIGSLLNATILFRARSSAQIALLGTLQGARWLEGRRREQEAASTLERASQFGLDDSLLREAELVMEGHASAAGIRPGLLRDQNLQQLRRQAVVVENRFVGNAGGQIDSIIADLSERNSRWGIRLLFELLLAVYLGFVLYRVGKNFFYDSFLHNAPLLTTDFYLAAGLFLILWCSVLVFRMTRRLQRGLYEEIRQMTTRLVEQNLPVSLFPGLEEAVRRGEQQADELSRLLSRTTQLTHNVSRLDHLGSRQPSRLSPTAPVS